MKLSNKSNNDDEQWLPVSDLMAGLMMVFLFIAVALMRNAYLERDQIKEIAVAYQENQVAIYEALMQEFESDLSKWDAKIEKDTLTFTFNSPEVLFARNQTKLNDAYRKVLASFFPRYLDVLLKYKDSINEVRIEGHTSSIWNNKTSLDKAYFNNMNLSQGRTREVLRYTYSLPIKPEYKLWIKQKFAAVGFSSSKRILNVDGSEDYIQSRRVSFRVITNSETQIRKILDTVQ